LIAGRFYATRQEGSSMQIRRLAAATAVVALSSAAFLYASHPARGSDHQDSPAVVSQPGADITDVYFFPSPANANNVDLVMDVIPLIPAGMSSNYSLDPSVLYQFKIAHGPLGTKAPADLAFQIQATGSGPSQTVTAYTANQRIGRNSKIGSKLGSFPFNVTSGTRLNHDVVAFAGPRADPFFFDLFQFFSILPDRYYNNPRTGDMLGSSTPTFNGYAAGSTSGKASGNYACSMTASTNALTQINGGFNVVSIVLEVPKTLLMGGSSSIVHIWATASTSSAQDRLEARYSPDHKVAFNQIELLSRPAVKELFEVFNDHAATNVAEPYDDGTLKGSINYFMRHVAGRSKAISDTIVAVLYPNELSADLSQPGSAAYLGVETGGATGSKFGGRGLTDDVIGISLGAVFGNTIPALGLTPDDNKENDCLTNEHVTSGQGGVQTQSTYPYVTTPH
jgi:hypothetical protein